ncbi:MAG: DUF3038 domain-containing protein [Gloeocapsa sp. DLM2.Bin57]|nr:MAG: DUF3038 domain-containing protein [Gloeocapsa sp. DLM2.Bin57]
MSLDNHKLVLMKNYLDLLSIAIVALTNLESKSLEKFSQTSQITLNEENLADFAQVISNKAQQHQELIRRAINLWENLAEQQQSPSDITLLANYLEQLSRQYTLTENQQLEQFGLKLLIDLLFYSTDHGYDRLWLVLHS